MPCSAEMRMAEADDGAVLMLVAGTVFIRARLINSIDVMRNGIGVRTYLYNAKRSTSTGECSPIPFVPMIGFTRSVFCAITGMVMQTRATNSDFICFCIYVFFLFSGMFKSKQSRKYAHVFFVGFI